MSPHTRWPWWACLYCGGIMGYGSCCYAMRYCTKVFAPNPGEKNKCFHSWFGAAPLLFSYIIMVWSWTSPKILNSMHILVAQLCCSSVNHDTLAKSLIQAFRIQRQVALLMRLRKTTDVVFFFLTRIFIYLLLIVLVISLRMLNWNSLLNLCSDSYTILSSVYKLAYEFPLTDKQPAGHKDAH